jgi:proline racemase
VGPAGAGDRARERERILAVGDHRQGAAPQGELAIGQTIQAEGLLGRGTFEGRLIGETRLDGQRAVVPTLKGWTNIVGYAKWLIDPADLVGAGFVIA